MNCVWAVSSLHLSCSDNHVVSLSQSYCHNFKLSNYLRDLPKDNNHKISWQQGRSPSVIDTKRRKIVFLAQFWIKRMIHLNLKGIRHNLQTLFTIAIFKICFIKIKCSCKKIEWTSRFIILIMKYFDNWKMFILNPYKSCLFS